jgi:acetyl esterase/lipase
LTTLQELSNLDLQNIFVQHSVNGVFILYNHLISSEIKCFSLFVFLFSLLIEMCRTICIYVFLSFYSLCSFAQASQDLIDVVYVSKNPHAKHKLDIHIPANVAKPAPCLVWFHWGGWESGEKGVGNLAWFAGAYKAGYICVDVNYRLSKDSLFPAQIYDCKAAIRFLKKNADLYNIDTCRMAVAGASAGAHLAALIGGSWNDPRLEGLHLGNTGVNSRVGAVVAHFGLYDLTQLDGYFPSICTPPYSYENDSFATRLFGCYALSRCSEKVKFASPINYIDEKDPPVYLTHGGADCTVPEQQSLIYQRILSQKGVSATLWRISGQNHGGDFWLAPEQQSVFTSFLNEKLKGGCPVVVTHVEIDTEPTFAVYPNPAKETIGIRVPQPAKIWNVEVMDILGNIIISKLLMPASQNYLSVRGLSTGIYFVQCKSEETILVQKILVVQ